MTTGRINQVSTNQFLTEAKTESEFDVKSKGVAARRNGTAKNSNFVTPTIQIASDLPNKS